MGDLNGTQTLPALLSQALCKQGVLVIVGPEGGLAPAELLELASHEVIATIWNPNVLRTETAGMAAIAVIQGLTFELASFFKLHSDERGIAHKL